MATTDVDIRTLQALSSTVVKGSVAADGSVRRGSGFTVKRINTGIYSIIFTTPFPNGNAPIIVAMGWLVPGVAYAPNVGVYNSSAAYTPTAAGVTLVLASPADPLGQPIDGSFDFRAEAA